MTLTQAKLIAPVQDIVSHAERALGPLPKASYLDLVADNIPHASLADLRIALMAANIGYRDNR